MLSCGIVNPNHRKLKCDRCQCGESICTRELREQLRKILGRRITLLSRASIPNVRFIVGRLIKVDCGTIIVESETPQITGPLLIKICDIISFACDNAFNPSQPTVCEFVKKQDETCTICKCKCTENECIRELREALQDCIGKEIGITTPDGPFNGALLKVSCGFIVLRDSLTGTPFIFSICAISSVIQFINPSSVCNLTNRTRDCKLDCHCECINDICTETLRDELKDCIGKEVTLTTEGNFIEVGRMVKVNCGTIILQLAIPILIPICSITSVRLGNQLPVNGQQTNLNRIIR